MGHLALALLGPLRIALDGQLVTAFESDKVRALLIYLALEADRPQRRAMLAELFWPDQPDRVGRHNLSQALFNLRRTIGDQSAQPPFLLLTRDTVQFNGASAHSVDATAFSALIAACDAHRHRRAHSCAPCADRLAAALELYRGDFLAQFTLADSSGFEEWAVLTRERLGQAALRALTALATYHELRGNYTRARELAQRHVALDPWRESAYRQLMRVLALDGQRPAALAAYARCRQVLAEQLGVEPDDETTALYEQLRDADSEPFTAGAALALPVARPHNLTAQLTPFVGREVELALISDQLANPQCRLLTLLGPGGIGKTRLAHQAAVEHVEVFSDGVFFVPLEQLQAPELLVPAIADALGVTLERSDEPLTQLVRYLQDKELLLLLDSFEQLLPGAHTLAQLLRAAHGVTLLVTTRERLDLHGEWLVEVGGLAVPAADHLDAVETSGAGQLWLQTARRVLPGYCLTDADRPAVARICQIVEGMPLAIELAAAWVRLLTSAEIAADIETGLALLTTTARNVPERHRSLRAVLEYSWTLLTETEQRVLRQLSVFRGGLEREAGARVAGASLAQLAALVDKSLLRSQPQGESWRRYAMHELVRQYAAEQLSLAGETEAARASHLGYFLALAEQAAPNLTGAEQGRWVMRLEAEHSNLRAALAWAVERGDVESAARICVALWRFWQSRGTITEGRQWIARVRQLGDAPESTAGGLAPALRAHLLKAAGVLAWTQSDYTEAWATFETSLALYQELADTDGIAAISSNLGVLALYQGDYARATELFETSLALRRAARDQWGTAVCLNNLGATAGKQGDLTRAQTFYEEGLAIYRELGYARGIAILLGNLGDVAQDRGQFERAHAFSTESLALLRTLEDTAGTAAALVRLGALALRRDDAALARTYYAESLPLFQALGDKEYIAICWEGFAAVAAAAEQWERAVRLWSAADAVRRVINVPIEPSLRVQYDRRLADVRAQLAAPVFAAVWAEGQVMSLEQGTAYALAR